MNLREAIEAVLSLQAHYSWQNTSEMGQRGRLIRDGIPKSLKTLRKPLADAMGIVENDLLIEGRDATGRKAEVPWVRVSSFMQSPRATVGWYVVWLFRKDGAGAYLALAHGSTQLRDGSFVPRDDADLAKLMAWSRGVLSAKISIIKGLVAEVTLASVGILAKAYEKSCVASFYYSAESIPDGAKLTDDLLKMADLLGRLYEAERFGKTPLSDSPEVRDIQAIAERMSRPTSEFIGQGIALTPPERRAIELHAMALATQYLSGLGYLVEDRSRTESFDLLATRGGRETKVEVKGTTGSLGAIILTSNEVDLHRSTYPENALIVVSSIEIYKYKEVPRAKGGSVNVWMPWFLNESSLKAIAYSYLLKGQD